MFTYKNPEFISQNTVKHWNHVVNGLETTSFLYTWVKLNAFFWAKAKIKTITDFQNNCNGHLIKSESSIKYLGIDIDQNFSGERTANAIIKKVNYCLRFR